MSEEDFLSGSGRRAWNYIVSGIQQGLNATEALGMYRGGGGAIRTSTWYNLYREAFAVGGSAERWQNIPTTYQIPASFAIDSGFDWRQEWVLELEVEGTDPDGRNRRTRWITIESDTRLTKGEYLLAAQEAIDFTAGSDPFLIERATDAVFYHRLSNRSEQ